MFHCQFPSCFYITESRSQIHFHHIVSREENGGNESYNLLMLCPNHHNLIYNPNSTSGIHSIKSNDSIIIKSKAKSTAGDVLIYETVDGKEHISKL